MPDAGDDADAIARQIVARCGKELRVATPLGLGKPVTLLNALTRLAVEDPSIRLSIFTALTLEAPEASEDMARRLLEPARERLFGAYPQIDYAKMLRAGELPPNIEVSEFFFLAGRWKGVGPAQRAYISANYSQALEVLAGWGPNVVLQLLAREDGRLSLSCNTDITLDLLRLRREGQQSFVVAGEVNGQLPFMPGTAEIEGGEVEWLLDPPGGGFELFSAVKRPVSNSDHAIGLHVSRLVRDGGTLQIGIGAIGDAVAHALLLRQREQIADIHAACPFPHGDWHEAGRFETGLYGNTEMLVDAMLPLFDAGVIGRETGGVAIHAAFFLGCREFYARLRAMPPERREKIAMMPVSFTNTLFGDEASKRAARRDARFVNSAMKATLLGAAVSDATGDGQVVSGVGGQFDFVQQAFALDGARSIITLPATRHGKDGRSESNIVWSYPHVTVPRHMRDIVVTEYGIADLRGRSDAEVIAAMLAVADSRFQDELLAEARRAGKIAADYRIPPAHRSNLPETLSAWLGPFRGGRLPTFPFGTDFTETEQRLLGALNRLKAARNSRRRLAQLAWAGLGRGSADEDRCIARMELDAPRHSAERIAARALRGALRDRSGR